MEDKKILEIKNKLTNIWNNSNVYVSNNNVSNINNNELIFGKLWSSCIYVEIINIDKLIEKANNDDVFINKVLKTFCDGIIEIFNYYGIQNINYSYGAIWGFIDTPTKNSKGANLLLSASYDINGFLSHFWKQADYKIILSTKPEYTFPILNNQQSFYFGSSYRLAKEFASITPLKNCIILEEDFVYNNEMFLYNPTTKTPVFQCTQELSANGKVINNYFISVIYSSWK